MIKIVIELDEREDVKELLTGIGEDINEGEEHGVFGGKYYPVFYDVERI